MRECNCRDLVKLHGEAVSSNKLAGATASGSCHVNQGRLPLPTGQRGTLSTTYRGMATMDGTTLNRLSETILHEESPKRPPLRTAVSLVIIDGLEPGGGGLF